MIQTSFKSQQLCKMIKLSLRCPLCRIIIRFRLSTIKERNCRNFQVVYKYTNHSFNPLILITFVYGKAMISQKSTDPLLLFIIFHHSEMYVPFFRWYKRRIRWFPLMYLSNTPVSQYANSKVYGGCTENHLLTNDRKYGGPLFGACTAIQKISWDVNGTR